MDCISIDKIYKLVLNSQWKQTALRPVMLQKGGREYWARPIVLFTSLRGG